MSPAETAAELSSRINIIEEAYEFMLAYASQGLSTDQGNDTGRQAREYLKRCDAAMSGLPGVFTRYVEQEGLQPTAPYDAFIAVIERDARTRRRRSSWCWPSRRSARRWSTT